MGDMSYDADCWAEAREGLLEVQTLLKMGQKSQKNHQQPVAQRSIADMQAAYTSAKSSAIGSQVHCPTCGKLHTKTTYHKVFCSNSRTRKGGNCKDVYWNSVDEIRAERANKYMMTKLP